MITFIARHPTATLDHLGYIPTFLSEDDPRPAREQIDERYSYGGGWDPEPGRGFVMHDGDILKFPGDPPMSPLCELHLRDERIVLYLYSVVAIIQPDGSFEVSRLD